MLLNFLFKPLVQGHEIHDTVSTSNHMFWDKLPECIFENFEIAQEKREQFQNFKILPNPNI